MGTLDRTSAHAEGGRLRVHGATLQVRARTGNRGRAFPRSERRLASGIAGARIPFPLPQPPLTFRPAPSSPRLVAPEPRERCGDPTGPATQSTPLRTIEPRRPISHGEPPRVAQRRAGGVGDHLHAASRPRMRSGTVSFQIVARKIALTASAAPATASAAMPSQRARDAEDDDRGAPAGGGEYHGAAVADDMAGPPAGQRQPERARGRRRVEQAGDRRAAVALCVGGEQRLGHREEHRVDVDEVGADQLRPRAREAHALDDPAQARRLRVGGRRRRAHPPQRGERDQEGERVDAVGGPNPAVASARRRSPGRRGWRRCARPHRARWRPRARGAPPAAARRSSGGRRIAMEPASKRRRPT